MDKQLIKSLSRGLLELYAERDGVDRNIAAIDKALKLLEPTKKKKPTLKEKEEARVVMQANRMAKKRTKPLADILYPVKGE